VLNEVEPGESVKLPGETTVKVKGAVDVIVPAVPVTVRLYVAVGVVLLVVSVSELVLAVGFGVYDAVTPLGSADIDSVTLPENPLYGLTVMVEPPAAPGATVMLPGESERLNPGVATTR